MRGTWVSVVLLVCIGGCDSSKKTAAPASGSAGARVAEAHGETGKDAGVARDAGPTAAPAKRDPIASLFRVVYTPGTTLPDKLREQITFRLKDKSPAPIALHHIIDIPRPDGGREVFALYEYSVYEDCVGRHADKKDQRERCRGHSVRVFDDEDPRTEEQITRDGRRYRYKQIQLNQNCLARGVVRAVFPPSGPGEGNDPGGSLAISALGLTSALCEVRSYNHVFVADVDGDDQLEMYVDLATAKEAVMDVRGPHGSPVPSKVEDTRRDLYILSGADVSKIELSLDLGGNLTPPDFDPEDLVELRDIDRDGHLDVIQTRFCYTGGGTGMPAPCDPPTERIAYVYDGAKDAYKAGGAARTMARRLHDRAMKLLAAKQPGAAAQIWGDAAVLDPTWSWPPYNLACIAALQGHPDDALAQLRLLSGREPDLDLLHRLDTDSDLGSVRDLPGFQEAVGEVARAAFDRHHFTSQHGGGDAGDPSCASIGFGRGGEYRYACASCCNFTGTYSYVKGQLVLEITTLVSRSGSGTGTPQPIHVHATYQLKAVGKQVCFDRVEATGLGDDLPREPLPDGCWE